MVEVILENTVHQILIATLFDKKLYLPKIVSAKCHNELHVPYANKGMKSLNMWMTAEKGGAQDGEYADSHSLEEIGWSDVLAFIAPNF